MGSAPFDEPRAPRRKADVVRCPFGCCCRRRRRRRRRHCCIIVIVTKVAVVGGIDVGEQSSDDVRRQHRREMVVVRGDALEQGVPDRQQRGRRMVLRASWWRDAFSRTSRYQCMKKKIKMKSAVSKRGLKNFILACPCYMKGGDGGRKSVDKKSG